MWVQTQPNAQSSLQKLNNDNSCQKTRKIRYFIFEGLPNFIVLFTLCQIFCPGLQIETKDSLSHLRWQQGKYFKENYFEVFYPSKGESFSIYSTSRKEKVHAFLTLQTRDIVTFLNIKENQYQESLRTSCFKLTAVLVKFLSQAKISTIAITKYGNKIFFKQLIFGT